MEEETKKKEKKQLLLVIAIFAVIFVVVVGGSYAYFSARATNSGDTITGKTLDINGTTLTIRADRVDLEPDPVPLSDDLVPAKFGVEPTAITTTEVNRALSKQCVVGGYTGCHVWKVTATSSIDIPSANIKLNLSLSNVTDKEQWSYVVYRGTDTNSETILSKGLINTTFPSSANTLDIHNGASLTANTPAIYYVMIYLNNTNSVQNDGVNDNTTDERGTYNGTVILEAMGGEVYVNFYEEEVQPTDVSFFEYTIENNEVTITGYRTAPIVTYTVSDQSACESYFENEFGYEAEDATTLCSGGIVGKNGTLENYIVNEEILSSDYATAGLSNVVFTEAPADVIIPSTIEGYPVVGITGCTIRPSGQFAVCEGGAFKGKGLTSIEIPSSVTTIGDMPFDSTTEVTLNVDMETIPSNLFNDKGITNLVLGEHVITISDSAFSNNSLTSIEVPSSVTSIGEYAFINNSLTSIAIGNENVTIGNCAFGENPPLDEPFLSNYVCE